MTTKKGLYKIKDIPHCAGSPKVHPALKEYFGYCFYKSALRYRAMLEREFEKYGLIPPQFGVMRLLKVSGPLSQVGIADEMGVDKATMVKLIDGLEKNGYIKRKGDEKDRRIKHIHLTPKGEKVLTSALGDAQVVESKLLSVLTDQQKKFLHEIVAKILETPLDI